MSDRELALVTGANRGIGHETCRQLAGLGYGVILTARDRQAARRAAQALAAEGLSVEHATLDVTDDNSVRGLALEVRQADGVLTALVNNAGVFLESRAESGTGMKIPPRTMMQAFDTNALGALRVTQALAPLMRRGACIVNVASEMGALADMGGGWPAYRVSKTALNALTRIFAAELADRGIRVNSVCPGWVRTDMGGPDAPKSVAEGADTIVWAATLPPDGPTGGFFRERLPVAW